MTPMRGIQPNEICVVWPHIEGLVKKAIGPRDDRTTDDFMIMAECEEAQLFVTPKLDCIVMTSILIEPEEKILNLFLTAGTLPHDYLTVLQALEGWGRSMACDAVEIREFRRGWERKLIPVGYRKYGKILRKELRQ